MSLIRHMMWKKLFARAIFQPSVRYCSLSYSTLASSCNTLVTEDGKKLHLVCDGEQERRYHGIWLRHNCRCPECLPVYSQQNIVHHSHLVDLKLANAKVEGEYHNQTSSSFSLWAIPVNKDIYIYCHKRMKFDKSVDLGKTTHFDNTSQLRRNQF